jgi:hypothetical protein
MSPLLALLLVALLLVGPSVLGVVLVRYYERHKEAWKRERQERKDRWAAIKARRS